MHTSDTEIHLLFTRLMLLGSSEVKVTEIFFRQSLSLQLSKTRFTFIGTSFPEHDSPIGEQNSSLILILLKIIGFFWDNTAQSLCGIILKYQNPLSQSAGIRPFSKSGSIYFNT